jgi:2-polyprenyl-3-methyl-5-hydroxy-6-metoxy-1,4-benzoquinol methylase
MNKDICMCCLSNKIVMLGRHAEYGHYECKECGYEFFIGKSRTASHLYENDGDYEDELAVSGDYRDLLQWPHHIAMRFLGRRKLSSSAILDVGCYNGFFVKKLCDEGYDAHGIDFNTKAIEYGIRTYGLANKIEVKDINDLASEGKQFDIITLFDVVEHVENPRELLQKLKSLLKSSGLLILSTPNNKMLWRPALDYPPHHLSRYDPDTLAGFVTSLGFEKLLQVEQMNIYNLARNYIGSLFRTKANESLRGGRLRKGRAVNVARTMINRLRRASYFIAYPVDRLLYLFGFRYIGQIIVCRKVE